jgi:hypothetical protein
MTNKHRWLLGGGVAAAGFAAMLLVPGQRALSADHFDPPLRTDPRPGFDPTPDRHADIADLFAFADNSNNVILADTIHTFDATINSPLSDTYDRDVLYTINVSVDQTPATPEDDSPATPEVSIRFRFAPGTNGTGFGVRFDGIPGTTQPLICKVEDTTCQVTTDNGVVRAYAGLRNDPFFFDLQGFRETISTGNLSFQRRDFFLGRNSLAVVLQIPRAALSTNRIGVWTTSARFGGQI